MSGMECSRCMSFESRGFPLAVRAPLTAHSLEPGLQLSQLSDPNLRTALSRNRSSRLDCDSSWGASGTFCWGAVRSGVDCVGGWSRQVLVGYNCATRLG